MPPAAEPMRDEVISPSKTSTDVQCLMHYAAAVADAANNDNYIAQTIQEKTQLDTETWSSVRHCTQ